MRYVVTRLLVRHAAINSSSSLISVSSVFDSNTDDADFALTTILRLGYKARAMFRIDRGHHGYWHHHHSGGGPAIVLQALTN